MINHKDFVGDDADWQLNCFIWTNKEINAMNVETIKPHTLRLWYKKKDDECFDVNDGKLPPVDITNPFSKNGSSPVDIKYTQNGSNEVFYGMGYYDYDMKQWVLRDVTCICDSKSDKYIVCNEESGIEVLSFRLEKN